MCGIAGFFSRTARPPSLPRALMAALKNRGPDAQHHVGWSRDWQPVGNDEPAANALIHARLSIIDPRPISDQPMANDDGSIWICYNGEVYDWAQHAEELKARGHVFRTRSDTEFILRAYESWGLDMLPRLRGMFAIAILDLRQRKLVLIRDRMGLKPLLYAEHDGDLAFGSTVRSVLPFLPPAAREWDRAAIDAFLAHRYVPAPRTIFQRLKRLPNAHWLTFDLTTRQSELREYWTPPTDVRSVAVPEAEWLATLDQAVSMRTVADRPLGVFLSSGIDSSTVASRLSVQGLTAPDTFSAAFTRADMDESAAAARIAAALGFKNHKVAIPDTITDDIDSLIADLDEPFADPSAIPTWYLARATTERVKVVLGGDGGDEMFAGYKRLAKHIKTGWRRGWLEGNNLMPRPGDIAGNRTAKVLDELRLDWAHAYGLRFSGFTPTQRVALQPALKIESPLYWRGFDQKWLKDRTPLGVLLEIDRLNYLPEYILRKGDLCTMAHGLELRAPLLDHQWVSLVWTMPAGQRFTTPPKSILSAAMPQLADLNLFEQKKKGFNPSLSNWLQRDLADRLDPMPMALEKLTDGQIVSRAPAELLRLYRLGNDQYAEQLLQLLFLQISLAQLDVLRNRP
jgi:asparagine synthase (glutamine-hydrolysing)